MTAFKCFFISPQQNINTVMLAVAQLLHIRMPSSYEAAFPQSPGRAGVGPGKVPDSSNPGNVLKLSFIILKVVFFVFSYALFVFSGMKADTSASQDAEWLKQFDVSLPGCTLRKQVDILALIKQASFLRISFMFFVKVLLLLRSTLHFF